MTRTRQPTRVSPDLLPQTTPRTQLGCDASQIYGSDRDRLNVPGVTGSGDGPIGARRNLHLERAAIFRSIRSSMSRTPQLASDGIGVGRPVVMPPFSLGRAQCIGDRLRIDYARADASGCFQMRGSSTAALIAQDPQRSMTPALIESPKGGALLCAAISCVPARRGICALYAASHRRNSRLYPGIPTTDHPYPPGPLQGIHRGLIAASLFPARVLIPHSHGHGREIAKPIFAASTGAEFSRSFTTKVPYRMCLYSLATTNPGALALHN